MNQLKQQEISGQPSPSSIGLSGVRIDDEEEAKIDAAEVEAEDRRRLAEISEANEREGYVMEFEESEEIDPNLRGSEEETHTTNVSAAQYSANMLATLPERLQAVQNLQTVSKTYCSLASGPKHILQTDEILSSADDLQQFWYECMRTPFANPSDRFPTVAITLLKFICNYPNPEVKLIFLAFLNKKNNCDLEKYVDHLLVGDVKPFPLSAIEDPIFSFMPADIKSKFNLLRMTRVRKDLVDIMISTFDSLCEHRKLSTGFRFGEVGPHLSTPKATWRGKYSQEKLGPDAKYTENNVSAEGIASFLDFFGVGRNEEGNYFSDIHNTVGTPFDHQCYAEEEEANYSSIHVIPLFRTFFEVFPPAELPIMLLMAHNQQACRVSKSYLHSLTSIKSTTHIPPFELSSYMKEIEPDRAVFVTKVAVKFEYHDVAQKRNQDRENPLPTPFQQNVSFELLNRQKQHVRFLQSTPQNTITRRAVVTYSDEVDISPGFMVQTDSEISSSFIEDYFENDYYTNIDASLTLFNLNHKDRFTTRIIWQAIEGHKDFVTAYLLTSTLHGLTHKNLSDEIKKLVSKSQNDPYANHVREHLFPEYKKGMVDDESDN